MYLTVREGILLAIDGAIAHPMRQVHMYADGNFNHSGASWAFVVIARLSCGQFIVVGFLVGILTASKDYAFFVAGGPCKNYNAKVVTVLWALLYAGRFGRQTSQPLHPTIHAGIVAAMFTTTGEWSHHGRHHLHAIARALPCCRRKPSTSPFDTAKVTSDTRGMRRRMQRLDQSWRTLSVLA